VQAPRKTTDDDLIASPAEVRKAIETLTKADHAKLMLIARSFARKRSRDLAVDHLDMVQDAITKTLRGVRKWKKSIPIVKHLDRVIESDSGHRAAKAREHPLQELPVGSEEPCHPASDYREQVHAADELDWVLRCFEGDETALELLRMRSQGLSLSEIQIGLGIDVTQYETVMRRIRRRVAKHLATGDAQ
jgi:DNA-directed RNA polymerase specialized sigma24 family protein